MLLCISQRRRIAEFVLAVASLLFSKCFITTRTPNCIIFEVFANESSEFFYSTKEKLMQCIFFPFLHRSDTPSSFVLHKTYKVKINSVSSIYIHFSNNLLHSCHRFVLVVSTFNLYILASLYFVEVLCVFFLFLHFPCFGSFPSSPSNHVRSVFT